MKPLYFIIINTAWKSRWPSWAPDPNKPTGFCGREAALRNNTAKFGVTVQSGRPARIVLVDMTGRKTPGYLFTYQP